MPSRGLLIGVSQYKRVNIDIGLVRFVVEIQADAACSYVILGEPISFYKKSMSILWFVHFKAPRQV